MKAFIDPRDDPAADTNRPPARIAREPEDVAELHRLCRAGRLYDVERWIRDGHPLQIAQGTPVKRARATSALEIALGAGNHALVLLLLANGYDPNQEPRSPLDLALRARRLDFVTLLLEWGADPHRVDLDDLFDTYNSELFTRFQDLGIDLTAGHALAAALAYHTSNRPWVLGQRFAAGGRTLHARAQLTVAQATPPPLVIAREEPPPRHSVVTGWPAAKHERVSFAQRLAADSALFVRPRG